MKYVNKLFATSRCILLPWRSGVPGLISIHMIGNS